MNYCTATDILDRLPQKDIDKFSDSDTGILNNLIAEAGAMIDGYLTAFDAPADVPAVLRGIALDITVYLLASRAAIPIWRTTELGSTENTVIVKRYNSAVKLLEDIRAGKVNPGLTYKTASVFRVLGKPAKFKLIRW